MTQNSRQQNKTRDLATLGTLFTYRDIKRFVVNTETVIQYQLTSSGDAISLLAENEHAFQQLSPRTIIHYYDSMRALLLQRYSHLFSQNIAIRINHVSKL